MFRLESCRHLLYSPGAVGLPDVPTVGGVLSASVIHRLHAGGAAVAATVRRSLRRGSQSRWPQSARRAGAFCVVVSSPRRAPHVGGSRTSPRRKGRPCFGRFRAFVGWSWHSCRQTRPRSPGHEHRTLRRTRFSLFWNSIDHTTPMHMMSANNFLDRI